MYQQTDTTAHHLIQAFSWMLIHSLWQGLLLAIVSGIILVSTKTSGARLRYNLVAVQFVLFILGCCGTFVWEWYKSPAGASVPLASAIGGGASQWFNLDALTVRHFAQTCINYFTANAPMVVLLWSVLFVFRSLRMMGSLVYIHRAKNKYTYAPPAAWQDRVAVLCRKLQLSKTVRLLESGFVKVPMVIGHLKPVILIPAGLLTGLPAEQIEAVLLHELAHIRRHDYIVNFLQTIAETVFFFNPGLLWMSSMLRDERENCCDDIALALTQNKRGFVQALISFKEHSLYGANYAVAFPGKKDHLLNRVSRIMGNKNKTLGPSEKVFFMMGIIILSVVIATAAIAQIRTKDHLSAANKLNSVRYTGTVPVAHPAKAESTISTIRSGRSRQQITIAQPPAVEAESLEHAPADAVQPVATLSEQKQKLDARTAQGQKYDAGKMQAERDRGQAERDKEQAKLAQEQAMRDQQQALRDQHQALLDREQAKRDQDQAKRDQEQAERDRQQTAREQDEARSRDAEQNRNNELQEKKNRDQEEINRARAKENEAQAKRNTEQLIRNEMQMARNKEQAQRNEEQAKRNAEQAKKNNASIQE